ncbi:DUF995 domain-containing protein [Planktotalea arctica]|uniref:DUF995 domain-containing protein n=1 Tax=Planktotalea arctica TaxID=1481893 RepID=UPI00111C8452|nr:DUF995 domain-containing protein [Planktotalea arctica]
MNFQFPRHSIQGAIFWCLLNQLVKFLKEIVLKKIHLLKAMFACGLMLTLAPAHADPKPRPATALSAQVVANKFVGHMQVWKGCKGGIYFGGNWEAVAYCGDNKDTVGIGSWNTKGGKICYQVTWYFVKTGQLSQKQRPAKCEVAMVSDKDGQVWHSWESDSDWWRGFPREKHFAKGNKYKRQIAKLRKKYGV